MNRTVSGATILHDLDNLARFSVPTSKGGVTRLPWTYEDEQVVLLLTDTLTALGLQVSRDAANNLWAVWDVDADRSIVMGSHRDSVPNGGRFDGALGVIGAVRVIQQLKADHYRPRHNIELVAWNDEEGARFGTTLFGSRIYSGATQVAQFADKIDRQGISLAEAALHAGYRVEKMEATKNLSRMAAYLELHIEQGPILERNHCHIGVVSGINVQFRERCTIQGIRVHAAYSGSDRVDPIFATAEVWHNLMTTINQANHGYPYPRIAATVGQVDVHSHLINAVPPDIIWTLDLRSEDASLAQEVLEMVHADVGRIAQRAGFHAEITSVDDHAVLAGTRDPSQPIEFDSVLQALVSDAARDGGYSFQRMASWAGHDAMALAPRVPTAMIFVPSHKGLSHTPEEWTDPTDLEAGVDVLLKTVLKADALA